MALTATFAADMACFLKSLRDAQVHLQVFDKATKTSFRDLTRTVEQFSGQKIAVEAARIAEAVERIGGVSKLTDNEQRRVNATVTEALAKYKALGQEAPAALQKLAAETARVEQSTQSLGGVLTAAFTGAVAGGAAAISAAALSAAKSLTTLAVQGIGQVVTRGGEVAAIGGAFEQLSGGVAQADQALRTMRASTSGLIANFDLMQASNKAMLLGLGLNTDQMGDLAKTAVTLGRAMGQGATKSLDDLITALGRSSPMILDNLGLSVKVGEANEQYARALGTTADKLTDAQRKQAFMTAAMEAARLKVAQLGDVQLTLTERVQQATTWLSNMFDRVSAGVVQSNVLAAGFDVLQTALATAFGDDQSARIDEIVKGIEEFAGQVVLGAKGLIGLSQVGLAAFGALQTPIRAISLGVVILGETLAKTVATLAELATKLPGVGSSLDGVAKAARQQADALGAMRKRGEELLTQATDLATGQGPVQTSLSETRRVLGEMAEAMERAQGAGQAAGAGAAAAATGIEKAGAAAAAADPKLKAFQQSLQDLSGRSALAGADEALKKLQALDGPLNVLPSKLGELADQFRAAAEAAALAGQPQLAAQYQLLAKTLDPVVQLQQRYNVTIGEFLPTSGDYTQAVRDQIDVLTRLDDTLYFGILPNLGKLAEAWVPFKAAVESAIPGIRRSAEELKRLEDITKRRASAEALRDLASAFADLAQSVGGVDGLLGRVAELVGLMSVAATAGNQFGEALAGLNDKDANVAEGLTKMAAAAVAVAASLASATDRAGAANRAFAGLVVGAQAGAQIGGAIGGSIGAGIGAGVGATIGGLVGILRKPAFEDVMRRVGRDWGVAISEGLARGIAAEADRLFGGNRQAAEIFNLDKILGEAGGLDASNLAQMTSKLHDVFSLLETGAFTSAQAVHVLDTNWRAFVQAGTDAAGRLAPSLTEIIRLTRELGVASQEVQGYLREQTATALEGTNAIINASKGHFDSYQKIADAVKAAQDQVDKLNAVEDRGRGVEWTREMAAAQDALTDALTAQHQAGEGAAGELENLGRIAMGTYAAAIQAGMTHLQAIQAAGPGLAQLSKAYENLGLSAEDAGLKEFLAQAKFVEANPEVLAGIQGLTDSFIALSNIGLLNADTFAAMEEAGQRMYGQLLDQAKEFGLEGDAASRAALLPMQDFLREAAKQAELLGVPLDENTQKLIDQSKELGIWKDKNDKAVSPLEDVRDAVLEMKDAVKELVDELKKIPSRVTTDVTTRYHTEGSPSGQSGPQPPREPDVNSRTNGAGGAGATVTIRVPVHLDGRQVAEVVVPHVPDALYRHGVA
ncbi:MAG: hypothetical protein AB7Q16_05960 [Vicinamibacterales bacterium]